MIITFLFYLFVERREIVQNILAIWTTLIVWALAEGLILLEIFINSSVQVKEIKKRIETRIKREKKIIVMYY